MKTFQQPLLSSEMLNPPSLQEMQQAFNILCHSTHQGVQGVLKIDAANAIPGETVGITVCTHGNEIAGLAPLVHYLRGNRLQNILKRGSVIFIANNLRAAQKFFVAQSLEEKYTLRFLDCNMNRLPENILELTQDSRYEIQRTLDLVKIFETFDVALDIHSTATPSEPMIIDLETNASELMQGAPISVVLSNIKAVQKGLPVASLYGGMNRQIPCIGIEAGEQSCPQAYVNATLSTQAFLQNLNLLPGKPEFQSGPRKLYRVSHSLFFPERSYKFVREFEMFEGVSMGQIIANNGQDSVLCPINGHILFAKLPGIHSLEDEVAFISDPVKMI